MKILFLYSFLLASGQTLEAEKIAVDPARHRPVRTLHECERIAAAQAERFRMAFATSENGIFVDVTITCERRGAQRRRKP